MTLSKKVALPAAMLLIAGTALMAQTASATHVRPKSASPFNVSLVPAYKPCTASNRVHAAPLAYNSCNPPVQTSPNITIGSPDANGAAANSTAFVKLVVTNGPGTNDADVAISSVGTDIRCQGATTTCGSANTAAGPDYVGALLGTAALNITDHNNSNPLVPGDPFDDAATGGQPSFPIVASCAATTSTTIGSTCTASTTANSTVPGAVVEGKRGIVELSQVQVFDGGPDGTPNTGNESLFAVQGIFIP